MACYLRAFGSDFDVDAFVAASPVEWAEVWHRGENKAHPLPGKAKEHRTSGLQIEIGDGDDFIGLLRDASEFIRTNRHELLRLASAPGMEAVGVDFGLTWDSDAAVRSVTLPPEFVALAGALRLAIEITYYDLN